MDWSTTWKEGKHGIDSSSTTLEWAMTEILKNRHVMNRIQEELANTVGVNSIVKESHLPNLPYVSATIKETLRLHPGHWGLPRSPGQTCVDIIIPGIDSSLTTLEWRITEILKNRHVRNRIQEEIANMVGVNIIVEESHLPKLQYVSATIKETLRLHPVGPLRFPRSPGQTWTNMKYHLFGSWRRLCPAYPLANKVQTYILASLFHSFNWSLPMGKEHDISDIFLGVNLEKRKPLILIPSQRFYDMALSNVATKNDGANNDDLKKRETYKWTDESILARCRIIFGGSRVHSNFLKLEDGIGPNWIRVKMHMFTKKNNPVN
ncbi:cytochrome P450 [Artemisia annua]|uniref:Cytochrome P450 n=1 Tax=Artemisia annua TaxID=35608 RepID=A0A2U1NBH1_ARTAN|nr:cytochrome P450 [Artemisia annua]